MSNHLRLTIPLCGILAAIALAPTASIADTLTSGSTVPAIEAQDQHEKPFKLEDGTEWLLLSFDMGTGKAANRYLEKQGAEFLGEHHAVFISNIYGMPGIGRMFALPKMRKYPHRIILADEKGLLDDFPQEDGMVTVLKLKPGLVIDSVSFWAPKKEEPPFAEE